jgi:hypothetical protein
MEEEVQELVSDEKEVYTVPLSDNTYDNAIGVTDEQLKTITVDIKNQFKGQKLFRIIVPYIGLFFIRAQNYSDVTESNTIIMKHINARLESVGGNSEVEKMEEDKKGKFMRELDEEISEMSNIETLKRCVLYPVDFDEKVDSGNIESGLMSLLLEKIMDISGWVDSIVEEI